MNNFEDLIRKQREEFNDTLPPEGHFERFQNKLNKDKLPSPSYFRIAATLIIGILITGLSFYIINLQNEKAYSFASIDKELTETLHYYTNVNAEMETELLALNFEDENEKKQILKDLEKYDASLGQIKKDLKKFPNNENIKNAIIEHFIGKTEFLEFILIQIKTNSL